MRWGIAVLALLLCGSTLAQEAPGPDPACSDEADRFVDCGNGTVTDTKTRLVWLKDASCADLGNATGMDFPTANAAAARLAHGACGLTDHSVPGNWRLPTKAEWEAVMEQAVSNDCSAPFLPDQSGDGCCGSGPCPFTGVLSIWHWSSTRDVEKPDFAWYALLRNGYVGLAETKSIGLVAWPVRSGQ